MTDHDANFRIQPLRARVYVGNKKTGHHRSSVMGRLWGHGGLAWSSARMRAAAALKADRKKAAATEPVLRAVPVERDASPATDALPTKLATPAHCKITGTIDDEGKIGIHLEQGPGALLAVFGSRETDREFPAPAPAFVDSAITSLLSIALGAQKLEEGPLPASAANAMLQMMQAFEPTNELEGAIAMQAAAIHHATMDCLVRGMRSSGHEFRQAHLGMANKCARTFATLVETLNRHRGKTTTQRVIVENVNVNAGGQAVVGAVAGVGSKQNGAIQPHGQTETSSARQDGESALRPALPGPKPSRQPVSAAGVEGKEALSHARRRSGKRGAQGKSKQAVARPLHGPRDRIAANGSGAASKRSGSQQVERE
jgi:hypothetical protein